MRKLLKGLFALVLAASAITCVPVQKVNAEISIPLVESDWDIAAYLINSDTVSEYPNSGTSSDGPASFMLDNSTSSWWHSDYSNNKVNNGDGNYSIVVEFNKTLTFDKIQGTGRSADNGKIENFEIYYINNDDASATISANSNQWIQLADTTNAVDGGFLYDCGTTITATHVKINVHDTTGGDNRFGCLTELDFLKTYNNYVEAETATPLDSSSFTVTVSGTSEGAKDNIFDGDPTTFWTSQSVSHVNTEDAWLQVDLGDVELINRVDYTKRYYDSNSNRWKCTGNIREYIIEVKENESDAWKQVSTGDISFDEDTSIYNDATQGGKHQIEFDAVKARYVRIRANSTYHHQAANVNKYMTVADLAIYSVKDANTVVSLKDKVFDGTTTNALFSNEEIEELKVMTGGTVEITYRVDDPTINKKLVLFAASNNAANGDYYAIWVNPADNRIGVDINDQTENTLSAQSNQGIDTDNTDWHTITIRNVNTDNTFDGANANGIYMMFDGNYVSSYRFTDNANFSRSGFITSVSGVNSVTVGYVDLASSDECIFDGEIASLNVYPNTISTDAAIANHSANIKKATEKSSGNRWVKNYLQNQNYLFESTYDAIGNEAIQMTGQLTSESYLLRYVDKNVLSVKAQAKVEDDGEYQVRFVTSVASLNPEICGFEYVINTETGSEYASSYKESTTVFSRIEASEEFVDAKAVFNNQASEYFATFTMSNIPTNVENYTITLKPYWTPLGSETKVYGVEKTYKLGDLFATVPSVAND